MESLNENLWIDLESNEPNEPVVSNVSCCLNLGINLPS